MFGLKPLYDRRSLIVSSEDMEPTEFGSMRRTAKAIGVNEGSVRYAKKIEKTFLRTPTLTCFSQSGTVKHSTLRQKEI